MQAEALLTASTPDKEYLPITGLPEFTKNAAKLAYGEDSLPLSEGSVRPGSSASILNELSVSTLSRLL